MTSSPVCQINLHSFEIAKVSLCNRCRSPEYRKQLEGPLPAVSVIISFYDNENISNILMTVHSVVGRTPPSLLHEIILVDDDTTKGESAADDVDQVLIVRL